MKWTIKSVRRLSGELKKEGHAVSHVLAAGLLRERGFSLQGNRKVREGGKHPDRNAQFEHINKAVQARLRRGEPAISVDIARMKPGTVTVSLDRDGELWLQGQSVPVEGLEYEVTALLEGKEDRLVVVKVDKALPHELYGPVFLALSRAGAEIGLMGEKVEP